MHSFSGNPVLTSHPPHCKKISSFIVAFACELLKSRLCGVRQWAGEWREPSEVVVGLSMAASPPLCLWVAWRGRVRPGGKGQCCKEAGVWLGAAGASSRCLHGGAHRAAGVKCEMAMKNRPRSKFSFSVKNLERSLGQGDQEGLWMSIAMGEPKRWRQVRAKAESLTEMSICRAGRVVAIGVCIYLCSADYFRIAA